MLCDRPCQRRGGGMEVSEITEEEEGVSGKENS